MSIDDEVPELLWGRSGVPGEFSAYVRRRAAEVTSDDAPQPGKFAQTGVDRIAEEMRADLIADRERLQPRGRHEHPRVPERIKQLLYLLHAYCYQHQQPAPASLLRLTFDALDLQRGRASEALHQISASHPGLPDLPGVTDAAAFLDAAARDGEADAAGKALSIKKAANAAEVARDTIRRWRQYPAYKRRREFTAMAATTLTGNSES